MSVTQSQPGLFDARLARANRDAAMELVETHADDAWMDAAKAAAWRTCLNHDTFLVDDVWQTMPRGPDTHDNRAMGAVMRHAVKNGWCESTGQFKASAQPGNHGNPRTVWRSLVFRGGK